MFKVFTLSSIYAKLLVVIAALCVVMMDVQAQRTPISLQDAIERGLQRHPRLLNATMKIDRYRASRGEAWDIEPTAASYSWGQLNGEIRNDYQWEVSQSFGSLLTSIYQNKLVNSQIATATLYRKIVEKEVVADIRRAWAEYQYYYNMLVLYKWYSDLTHKMEQACSICKEEGNINRLEQKMIRTLDAEQAMLCMQTEEQLLQSIRHFSQSCYSDVPVIPNDTSLSLFNVLLFAASQGGYEVSNQQMKYQQGLLDEVDLQVRIEKSSFFPEISFGYINQKISPYKGLDAWMVGISFPLIFNQQQSRIKQARIEAQIARNESDAVILELQNKVLDLQSHLRQQNEQIHYYMVGALVEADELLKELAQQLDAKNIDIAEFIQSLTTARELQEGYIETVYQYNLVVIDLELYTDIEF